MENQMAETAISAEQVGMEQPIASGEVIMQKSWYETVSGYFKGYPSWAVEIGIFGLGSLLIGYLAKSLGRYFLLLLVGIIILLIGLHYTNIMVIDMVKTKQFLGLSASDTLQDIPTVFIAWAKVHIVAVVSIVVGFIIGWKLG